MCGALAFSGSSRAPRPVANHGSPDMLQTLREKTSGWVAFLILAAVSIPFAFFGINNYFTAQTETYVAKVGETEITTDEFRQRFEEWRQQQRRAMGENFDPAYFDQPLVKRQMLDRMIDERLRCGGGVLAPRRL